MLLCLFLLMFLCTHPGFFGFLLLLALFCGLQLLRAAFSSAFPPMLSHIHVQMLRSWSYEPFSSLVLKRCLPLGFQRMRLTGKCWSFPAGLLPDFPPMRFDWGSPRLLWGPGMPCPPSPRSGQCVLSSCSQWWLHEWAGDPTYVFLVNLLQGVLPLFLRSLRATFNPTWRESLSGNGANMEETTADRGMAWAIWGQSLNLPCLIPVPLLTFVLYKSVKILSSMSQIELIYATYVPKWVLIRSVGNLFWAVVHSTATTKSLQSCPTLCDPIDGSPPGSPFLGFSREEHWSALPFPSPMHESEKWKWCRSVVSGS